MAGAFVDVHIVVEIDEVVMNCLTEYGQTKPGKEQVYTDSCATPANVPWYFTWSAIPLSLPFIRYWVTSWNLLG